MQPHPDAIRWLSISLTTAVLPRAGISCSFQTAELCWRAIDRDHALASCIAVGRGGFSCTHCGRIDFSSTPREPILVLLRSDFFGSLSIMQRSWDVIVVGARTAGAPLAM